MTVPQDYVNASRDFDRFMDDLLEISMLATHHQAYAVLRGVLHVFRDHLTAQQAALFAGALPAVLRAIFVEDWRPHASPSPFPDEQRLIAEVRAVRRDPITSPRKPLSTTSPRRCGAMSTWAISAASWTSCRPRHSVIGSTEAIPFSSSAPVRAGRLPSWPNP
jgi:uncharacterized protein (DUF2267 family)